MKPLFLERRRCPRPSADSPLKADPNAGHSHEPDSQGAMGTQGTAPRPPAARNLAGCPHLSSLVLSSPFLPASLHQQRTWLCHQGHPQFTHCSPWSQPPAP